MIEHVVAGGFTLDDTVLLDGTVVRKAPGGNALYAAAGARLWTSGVGLVAPVGTDYPESHLERLRRAGFDLAGVRRLPGPSIHMWALHEPGDRRQLIYQLASGRNDTMDPRPEHIPASYRHARSAHVAALPSETQVAMVASLRPTVPVISLDVVHIPGHIELSMVGIRSLLEQVDLFLPSREEVCALCPTEDPLAAARRLAELGPGVVAIKLGAEGVLGYERRGSRAWQLPSFPCPVRDTTGAGDAFCGAFSAVFGDTGDALEAAIAGVVAASFIIQDFGALHALTATPHAVRERAGQVRRQARRL